MMIDAESLTGIAVVASAAVLLVRRLRREWREESDDASCSSGCAGCPTPCALHDAHPEPRTAAVAFVRNPKEGRS